MAAFFWIHAGANNNWATNGNWSATSGGGTNGAQPSVTSDVTFDGAGANGNDASTISATQSVLSFTVTSGYTNTLTHNAVLTVAGNVTLNTSYTIAGSSAMVISAASTMTSGGKTWPNTLQFTGANTKTLVGDWVNTGVLNNNNAATVLNRTTAETITLNGGIGLSQTLSGTATILLNGGTWSGGGVIQNSLSIAGNVTISAGVAYNTGTLTYTSGTVTTTGSTVTIGASTTLNTAGISWNNITISAASTITINSLLTVTGTLTLNASLAITFAGTSGWTVGTFSCLAFDARTITFANTVTYTITTAFNAFSSRQASQILFTSDHASNKAIITLTNTSTTCNVIGTFTRIDASAGRPIVAFNGTITTCFNIVQQSTVLFRPMESYDRKSRRFYLANKNKSVIYQ